MKQYLAQLLDRQPLTQSQAGDAFEKIMTGQASPAQIAALLAMIQQRGVTVDELTGAARVMRGKVAPVHVPAGLTVVDTCGTGGDHTPTFNVSTAAAIVAAAVGRPHNIVVAKHGNRTVTRTSGSSQGLEALGVKLNVTGETLTRCLDEAGICFCFAPAHHPAMKFAAPVRQELGIPTLFNLLGPLTNPAGATCQVMGVARPALTDMLIAVLKNLGAESAMVVHGYKSTDLACGGFCELSVSGPSRVSALHGGQINTYRIQCSQFDITPVPVETLFVESPEQSARRIMAIFQGEPGPGRQIVAFNAAAALVVTDLADDLREGMEMACEAIDAGRALKTLQTLAAITNQ